MLPTYGRSETKLPKFLRSMIEAADDISNVCASFVVNKTDHKTIEKIVDICQGVIDYEMLYEDTKECNLATYFNMAYKQTSYNGDGTCVSMFGDDMVFDTKGWDTMMLEKINDVCGMGIVYGDDDYCQHENLCVYFITSRQFVEFTGKPFMCESFSVDFMDNIWFEVAKRLGCAYYLPKLHIRHEHATKQSNMDEVWLRMRDQYDKSSKKNAVIAEEYICEIVLNVKNCLTRDYLSKDISYCMTTYDRIGLLKQTIDSWNKSVLLPQKLFVFDDGSMELQRVAEEIARMKSACIVPGNRHVGCNNMNAIAVTHFDTPAVMVIDSDTVFSPGWCIAANMAWEEIKDNPDIAGVTIFNCTQYHKQIEKFGEKNGLIFKGSVGGFGTIYKKETVDSAFETVDVGNMPATWGWDGYINEWAKNNNKVFACTKKSYLQHMGYTEGVHVSDIKMGDYAEDFTGEIDRPKPVRYPPSGGTVLFAAMARMGDVIAASMVANMLIERGMQLTFMVINRYGELARRICPNATIMKIEPLTGGPAGDWSETTAEQMKFKHQGFSAYINAQVGSRENHDDYTTSGKHPCAWIRDECNRVLGIELGENFRDYLRFNDAGIALSGRDVRIPDNLAIICGNATTSQAIATNAMRQKIFNDLKRKGYSPRFLVEKRPQGMSIRQLREEYVFGLSVEQCILLLKQASHYVGQDSGPSWCALYSDCTKQIYHLQSRIKMVNTYFSKIDPKAEDVVMEG